MKMTPVTKMIVRGVLSLLILALFGAGLYTVWWFFEPETFWQRFFCVIVEIPVGIIWGIACTIMAFFVWADA